MQHAKSRRPTDETYSLGMVIVQAVPSNCAATNQRTERQLAIAIERDQAGLDRVVSQT